MKKILKGLILSAIMGIMILSSAVVFADTTNDGGVVGIGNLNSTAQNSAKLGDKLILPELGWKRYTYDSQDITYVGTGWFYLDKWSFCYLNEYGKSGSKIRFNFTGTKVRFISAYWTTCSNDVSVKIDGQTVDKYVTNNGTQTPAPILTYEKIGLVDGEHSVEIVNNTTDYLPINSIDIDGTGVLKPFNEIQGINVSNISLNKSSLALLILQSETLIPTITPTTATNQTVTWTSSDPTVATVDITGKVTGVKVGTANITATTTDGSNITTNCAITVTDSSTTTPTNPTDGTNTIVNIAHAKGDNTNNAGGEVSIIFNGVPDTTLSVVKTANVKSVWVGDTFTYTIVVKNTGSKVAKSVVINDSAPNHIQFMPSGITTTQGAVDSSSTSSNIVVNVGDIPPSGTVTITVPATVVF